MTSPAESWLEGKYEVLGKIGQGGMGAVYKARHRLLDEVRVIKVLRADQADRDELQQRFQQEARTAIRLKHPGIAQLHDFAVANDGTAYIVMEYIEGVPLDNTLETCGKLPAGIAVQLARQALGALHYLHQQGYVHRDIAPDNLMVCRGLDGKPQIKIIDLGIARNVGKGTSLTTTGSFVGKVRYSSPEQFTDSRDVDARSDVYSFGLILYEMLTGQHPLPGDSFQVMAASHLFTEPTSFEETDPEGDVPEELRSVVLRALAKKPEDRQKSAAQLASELAALSSSLEIEEDGLETLFEQAMASRPRIEAVGTTDQHRLDEEFHASDRTGADDKTSPAPASEPFAEPPTIVYDHASRSQSAPGPSPPAPRPSAPSPGPTSAPVPPAAAAPQSAPASDRASRDHRSLLLAGAIALVFVLGVTLIFLLRPTREGSPAALEPTEQIAAADRALSSEGQGALPVPPESDELDPAEEPVVEPVIEEEDEIPDSVALGGDRPAVSAPPAGGRDSTGPATGAGPRPSEPVAAGRGDRGATTSEVGEQDAGSASGGTPSGPSTPGRTQPSGRTPSSQPVADPQAERPSSREPAVELEILNQRSAGDRLRFRRGFEVMPRALSELEAPPPPAGSEPAVYEFDIRLDETGSILEIEAIGDAADVDYAQALENALYRTRFSPGLRNERPVRGQFRVRLLVD